MGPAHAASLDYPSVKLQALDKITARTITFEGKVGTTLKFASIYIKIQTCQKPPAYERSDASAFLQIWEVSPQNESKWIFSGWMFAASPAVSAMDHPIYDVWVVDCVGEPIGGDSLPPPEAADDISDEELPADAPAATQALPADPAAAQPEAEVKPATPEKASVPDQPQDPVVEESSPAASEKPVSEDQH